MEKILISACLLGEAVRYDGESKPLDHPLIQKWKDQGRLLPFCPEVDAGMPVPRPPAEIFNGSGEDVLLGRAGVKNRSSDVTLEFIKGAQSALDLIRTHGIRLALLKEKSPSCGSTFIYDGSFRGQLITGMGITTALLRENGIKVFSENQIQDLAFLMK